MARANYVEAGRTAHELMLRMGREAHKYAARLAAEALEEGKLEESEFWRAVEAAVKPRSDSETAETQI